MARAVNIISPALVSLPMSPFQADVLRRYYFNSLTISERAALLARYRHV